MYHGVFTICHLGFCWASSNIAMLIFVVCTHTTMTNVTCTIQHQLVIQIKFTDPRQELREVDFSGLHLTHRLVYMVSLSSNIASRYLAVPCQSDSRSPSSSRLWGWVVFRVKWISRFFSVLFSIFHFSIHSTWSLVAYWKYLILKFVFLEWYKITLSTERISVTVFTSPTGMPEV